MPVYATINVEDKDKAARLLEQLASRVFLKQGSYLGLPTELDAYRVPDYKGHALYVLSFQLYAVKVRLHVALVGDQLVAATKPKVLFEVIDASSAKDQRPPTEAHLLLRLNRKALNRFQHDLELFWEEKARHACHDNIMSIYTLLKLYGAPMAEINHLADTKYGVTYRSFVLTEYRDRGILYGLLTASRSSIHPDDARVKLILKRSTELLSPKETRLCDNDLCNQKF